MKYSGGCHCGNIKIELVTPWPVEAKALRTCGCTFCSTHAAATFSDPSASVAITVEDSSLLTKYQFGLKTAEFFLCKKCGVYLAALLIDGDRLVSTINVRSIPELLPLANQAIPARYKYETESQRRTRRLLHWTPTKLET